MQCSSRAAPRRRPSSRRRRRSGQQVEALLSLSPDWSNLASAIGGGPRLVKNGRPIFHTAESFASRQLNGRQARGAIGQLSDGRIVLVSVEGTKPAYSIGMSNYELAVELSRLGATTAFGLGAGSASGLAFDGKLLTRPSTGVTPKVSDALVLSYSGVYAAPSLGARDLAERRRCRRHRVVLLPRHPSVAGDRDPHGAGRREDHARQRRRVAGAARARVERDRARLARGRRQVDVQRYGNRRPQRHDERAAPLHARRHALVARAQDRPPPAPDGHVPADAGGDDPRADPAAERRARWRRSARGSGRPGRSR